MSVNKLKQTIKREYLKCAEDPTHFMKKYCFIQHPQRGRIQFSLFPFQEKVLALFQDNPYSMVLKARQLGISTLTAGYSLWCMLFNDDFNSLVIATKQDVAKNLDVVSNRKFVAKVLRKEKTESELRMKLSQRI